MENQSMENLMNIVMLIISNIKIRNALLTNSQIESIISEMKKGT